MPEALFNLGATLQALGRLEEASGCFQKVLAVLIASGDQLVRDGRDAEAIDFYQRALQIRPDDADVAFNLGIALHSLGRYGEAIDSYDRALRAEPGRGETLLARALSLLTMGDFARGWREYECRHAAKFERPRAAKQDFAFPMWRGEPLAGKRILLVGEQGYGDQVQFIRYAALLARQGAMVDVVADARLQRLISSAPGVRKVVPEVARDAAGYDYWSLLLSLPLRLGTLLESVPAEIPYLRPPPEEVKKWADRLRVLPQGRPKVGLVWIAGHTGRERLHGRSMGFEPLRPLARLAGINFVGLQFGEREVKPADVAGPAEFPALQLGAEVGDFADNAALLANLDLLVTVDTAAGHLAGALGIPAWIMLPANPDWRWMWGREDSPWYPGVRLLRQPTLGDWAPVVERVARDLQAFVARPA